jgi:peptidyl-prolyl cis-trans isomerase B (cyclophilin B)
MALISAMKIMFILLGLGLALSASCQPASSNKADASANPASTNAALAKGATTNTAAAAAKPTNEVAAINEVAVIKTSEGEMVVEFWPAVAPKTVENFKKLAKSGFYDGTLFHRIIKGFMIQGGDPLTKDPKQEAHWGEGDPGYKIKAEFNNKPHVRGVLSMARSASPDSAGSQFFICLAPAPSLDHKYTTFGQVIKGDDVLGRLGDSPVGPRGNEISRPLARVTLESIKIVPADSIK